jgi:beta-glucosidase
LLSFPKTLKLSTKGGHFEIGQTGSIRCGFSNLKAPKGDLDKPAEELKGFAKTGLLKPEESQTLTFTINAKDLASFKTDQSAWVADRGRYEVKIGASSEDIKQTTSFTLNRRTIVEKVTRVLMPPMAVAELKSPNQE